MRNLVPLTKILLTLGTAVWAIIFREPFSLAILCVLELIILLVSNELFKNVKALMMLCVFAFFLGLIEYIGGGTEKECAVAALRMLGMTIIFIYLLATVRLQDLTAAMVQQLKVPYEYAFMLTTALRFVPDFLAESKAVREAQACRGYHPGGNPLKRFASYLAVVQPLVLRAITRSETMAVSLELRGFGAPGRTFAGKVSLHPMDYLALAAMAAVSVWIIVG